MAEQTQTRLHRVLDRIVSQIGHDHSNRHLAYAYITQVVSNVPFACSWPIVRHQLTDIACSWPIVRHQLTDIACSWPIVRHQLTDIACSWPIVRHQLTDIAYASACQLT